MPGTGSEGESVDATRAAETPGQHGYPHGVLAVVPVKGRDGAKTRLAPLLQPEERTRLVLDMLERVLEACAGAGSITGTLLVTPDPGIAPGLIPLRETLMVMTGRPVNIQATRRAAMKFRGDTLGQPYVTLIDASPDDDTENT